MPVQRAQPLVTWAMAECRWLLRRGPGLAVAHVGGMAGMGAVVMAVAGGIVGQIRCGALLFDEVVAPHGFAGVAGEADRAMVQEHAAAAKLLDLGHGVGDEDDRGGRLRAVPGGGGSTSGGRRCRPRPGPRR